MYQNITKNLAAETGIQFLLSWPKHIVHQKGLQKYDHHMVAYLYTEVSSSTSVVYVVILIPAALYLPCNLPCLTACIQS